MSGQPTENSVATAGHTVALLDARAAELRAELLELRKQLADVKGDLRDSQAVRLQEANQQLLLAALQADRIAEDAVASLAAANDLRQRDGLTGLPNRALGLDRLANAIEMSRRNGKRLAIFFLDLDHFKAVNDNLGHTVGDQVLQLVTQRLQSVLRESDTVSRYGGDEFLVLLPDISEAADAGRVAVELLASLTLPDNVAGHVLTPSASLGVSLFPDDGEDATTLVNRADAAMYRCKRRGTGRFEFFGADHVEQDRPELVPDRLPLSSLSTVEVPASAASREHDLCEANQQLVMASLVAQASEALAKKAQRDQMTSMAMVAHELRNPLTPLRIATEMLTHRGGGEDTPIGRLAAIITSSAARMARLVDDLLEGSCLSTGKLRLEFSIVDVVGILNQAVTACRPAMQARQQRFSATLLAGPVNVRGDPIRLAQIFNNLLDNASKYTPEGGEIALGMSVTQQQLSISVRDNGRGIAADMLPTMFDLFVQDGHNLPHASGGMGIGLAVVRDLVQAHGGTVTGRSDGRDLGSEFVATLPLL